VTSALGRNLKSTLRYASRLLQKARDHLRLAEGYFPSLPHGSKLIEGEHHYLWSFQLSLESFVRPVVERCTRSPITVQVLEPKKIAEHAMRSNLALQEFYKQAQMALSGDVELLLMSLLQCFMDFLSREIDLVTVNRLARKYCHEVRAASGENSWYLVFAPQGYCMNERILAAWRALTDDCQEEIREDRGSS